MSNFFTNVSMKNLLHPPHLVRLHWDPYLREEDSPFFHCVTFKSPNCVRDWLNENMAYNRRNWSPVTDKHHHRAHGANTTIRNVYGGPRNWGNRRRRRHSVVAPLDYSHPCQDSVFSIWSVDSGTRFSLVSRSD